MKSNSTIIILLFCIIALPACKITAPSGTQVAEPLRMGLLKGPIVISSGKIFFMEDKAVYKPNAFSYVRSANEFDYTEIDTVTNGKFHILAPITAKILMKNGERYKVNILSKRKYLIQTLNNLKR